MTIFGVSLVDLLLLTFCFSIPFAVLALVVAVLYRRDRARTPPEAADIAGDIHPRYPTRRLKPTGNAPLTSRPPVERTDTTNDDPGPARS